MENRWCRGHCYNCDEKWVLGHKCKEKKLFQIDVTSPPTFKELTLEETQDTKEETPSHTTLDTGEPEIQQEEPLIYLYALSSISSPQTLKIRG